MGLQSVESPNFENFRTPNLGVLRQNNIWVQPSWLIIENTIKGKVMASPKFRLWWILWIRICPWLISHQKWSNYVLTNLFGSCKSVWIVDSFIIRRSPHPRALARPFYPKVMWTRECIPTPFSFVVFIFKFAFESFKEFGGVSQFVIPIQYFSLLSQQQNLFPLIIEHVWK